MATLRGFPPSNMIAPGIKFAESDLSYIAPNQSLHRAGLVGFASKGPINLPIVVTTSRQLHQIFGNPHPDEGDPLMIYAAEQYLLVANELYIVRVAETDSVSDEAALTASVDVPAAGTLVKIESATAGDYTFGEDSFFRWKLNGILSSKTLVVLADTYTATELADLLNLQLDSEIDGIEFYVTDSDAIAVKSLWAYGVDSSIELISTANAIYGDTVMNGNITGLGTGMTPASVTGDVDKYPNNGYQTSGNYDFTGLSGLTIQIVVDGTDNVLIDGVVQEISLADIEGQTNTIDDVVDAINANRVEESGSLPGGWVASAEGDNLKIQTLHTGRDARLRVKPDSTAEDIFGLSTVTAKGESPEGVTGDVGVASYGIVTGDTNSDNTISFTVNADSPGIEGNATQVKITNNESSNSFTIEVFNNGVGVEVLGNLTKDQASSYYVSTYVELASNYIKVSDNDGEGAAPADGTYTLSGGTDGIPADSDRQDELIVGNKIGSTGIYVLSDVEAIDIDLVAAPGRSSTSVVSGLLDFCQSREDCLAIIDPPFGLTAKEVVDWQNGIHPLNGIRFDTDYGALYWPWVKIRDTYNKVDVWVPPSGSIMAVIARSDFLGAPWLAPAGETRGVVPGIGGVYSVPTAEEKDAGYGNRNCVNMITRFNGVESYVVMGQKTMQRKPTALDRISVRRLLFLLKKRINSNCKVLLFEPNDEIFRRKFTNIVTQILREVQIGRGITDFIIKADEELNTSDVIDRNEFRAQIGIQPTRSAEFMFVEFSLHRTGSFTENADEF